MRFFANCVAVSVLLGVAASHLAAAPVDGLPGAGTTNFHDQEVMLEGHLIAPEAGQNGEYRLQRFDSEDSYILKLTDEQKKWADECAPDPVKVQGTYREGGVLEAKQLWHWFLDSVSAQMVDECNRYRKQHGLAPLQPMRDLLRTAFQHSWNMRHRYGFRHGGTSGWSGENIAAGQPNAVDVTRTWYHSSGHRANMLNASYRYIGVGHYNGMWTQQFR